MDTGQQADFHDIENGEGRFECIGQRFPEAKSEPGPLDGPSK